MHISLAAETLFQWGWFPVTNTLLTSLLTSLLLLFLSIWLTRSITIIPGKKQNIAEGLLEPFFHIVEDIAPNRAPLIFPIVTTFFIFILFANLTGFLPGVGSIGLSEHTAQTHFVPLLRPPTSDLNVTLALALVSLILTHAFSIKVLGLLPYLSRFFSINPIYLFVGLIELSSEFTKLVSLSFRLFGNIFAGETVLSSISSLGPFLFPLPFIGLEIIVAVVQASVFMMLTLVFMAILTEKTIVHG